MSNIVEYFSVWSTWKYIRFGVKRQTRPVLFWTSNDIWSLTHICVILLRTVNPIVRVSTLRRWILLHVTLSQHPRVAGEIYGAMQRQHWSGAIIYESNATAHHWTVALTCNLESESHGCWIIVNLDYRFPGQNSQSNKRYSGLKTLCVWNGVLWSEIDEASFQQQTTPTCCATGSVAFVDIAYVK